VKRAQRDRATIRPFTQVSARTTRKFPQLPKLMSGDAPGMATAASPGRLWAVQGQPTTTSNNQRRPQPRSSSAE
jgi:hypothetical protein